jgi:hypothetical protein
MERVEQMKMKHTHSWDASRNPLKIDLNINNERQYYKIGIMCMGACGSGRVNEGD